MITIKTKVQSDDLEQESRYIESISNDKKSFLDLKDPYKKPRSSGKATHDPVTKEITEDTV